MAGCGVADGTETIDFGEFLSRLGHLHDCTVRLLEWNPDEERMGFEIEDLYFNFAGLPEYPGPMPGRIVLEGIQRVDIEIRGFADPLRVFEFSSVKDGPDMSVATVTSSPSGKVAVTYRHATFPVITLP
jgi:hypothetical protein